MVAFDPKIRTAALYDRKSSVTNSLRNEGILLQELAHQFHRGVLVSLGLDEHIEDFGLSVDGPPKETIQPSFSDNLVEMPSRMRLQTTLRRSAAIIGPKWFTQRRTVS